MLFIPFHSRMFLPTSVRNGSNIPRGRTQPNTPIWRKAAGLSRVQVVYVGSAVRDDLSFEARLPSLHTLYAKLFTSSSSVSNLFKPLKHLYTLSQNRDQRSPTCYLSYSKTTFSIMYGTSVLRRLFCPEQAAATPDTLTTETANCAISFFHGRAFHPSRRLKPSLQWPCDTSSASGDISNCCCSSVSSEEGSRQEKETESAPF